MSSTMSILLLLGIVILVAFFGGKIIKLIKLPSIIGYMIIGVILGPSLVNLINVDIQNQLTFLTDIALGFVALSIGLELNIKTLKKLGSGIVTIIFFESFAAFILVTLAIFLLTKDLPLALVLGAVAPASAPAGTVAIIQEFKAKGTLTNALYAVVGFDDGLGIIIFGFASAIAQNMLKTDLGQAKISNAQLILAPLGEIGLAILVGFGMGILLLIVIRFFKTINEKLIMMFGFVFATIGISNMFGLSLILTNMIMGILIVNRLSSKVISDMKNQLESFMPLIFVLFFTLAGANLQVSALPTLGAIGACYIIFRTVGLMGGARIGATLGHMEEKIRKYLGFGILSQAGVAIGLSLIVKKEFEPLGSHGMFIGTTVITMITATSIFFGFLGPTLTRIGLTKAGEIQITHKG